MSTSVLEAGFDGMAIDSALTLAQAESTVPHFTRRLRGGLHRFPRFSSKHC